MAPKGLKVKPPTAAQVQKEDSKARSKKRVDDNEKLNAVKEEKMKMTHYAKDTGSLKVEYATLSPSKKRVVHLADIPSSSSGALHTPSSDPGDSSDPSLQTEMGPLPMGPLPLPQKKKNRYQVLCTFCFSFFYLTVIII
ncbi:hypothetical protein MPER_08016 [Moniliophthora perniciosa FA553]|nr:hypothetical protein MPER_08016 [Moniliophthora perniciosa FA553]